MTIRIGKATDNDVVIDNPYVSRTHAQLTWKEGDTWLLEDTGSTNGTFVNEVQIVRKQVMPTDIIALGDSTCALSLADILHQTNNYSIEFAALKPVYDSYTTEKVKIQSSNLFRSRLLQSLPFALPGVIGVLIGFFGKGSPLLFGISLCAVIIAPTVGIYMGAKQAAKAPGMLQKLYADFQKKYLCPKCGSFPGEQPWEVLRSRKQCPFCKARWAND
jgi:hypothetical protein